MFKAIRTHSKTIVWLIVLAFIFWGGSSLLISQNKSTSYAGEIFGKRVSYKEYNDTHKMLNLFMDAKVLAQSNLESEIWFHIALKREAERRKMPVLDQEVKQEILKSFGGGQAFDASRYEQWVHNVLRENPRNFEEMIRDYIRIQKLIRQIVTEPPIEVTDEEIEKKRRKEKIKGKLDAQKREELQKRIREEKGSARFAQWTQEFLKEARIKPY